MRNSLKQFSLTDNYMHILNVAYGLHNKIMSNPFSAAQHDAANNLWMRLPRWTWTQRSWDLIGVHGHFDNRNWNSLWNIYLGSHLDVRVSQKITRCYVFSVTHSRFFLFPGFVFATKSFFSGLSQRIMIINLEIKSADVEANTVLYASCLLYSSFHFSVL